MDTPQEERVPVHVDCVIARCGCGGEMRPTGQLLLSHPPQAPHQCDRCQRTAVYAERYPLVRYRVID
jgi:hypothetical protein